MPPTLIARATHGKRIEVQIPYHGVPVPSIVEVHSLSRCVDEIAQAQPSERVDVTPLLDLCLRFTCLAYRRHAPTSGTGLALHAPGASPHGVELQFRSANGAHAVAYLFCAAGSKELHAVLSFKGSTLSSPSAPFLSDWVANLQPAAVVNDEVAQVGLVHSGWSAYLAPLVCEMRACTLPDCLPDAVSTAWRWPTHEKLSLWALLSSSRCTQTLVVGHSMGGALATLAATQLAREAQMQRAKRPSTSPAAAFIDGTLRALFASGSEGEPSSRGGGSSGGGGGGGGSGSSGASGASSASNAGSVPEDVPCPAEGPVLITFGCPVVGDHEFVLTQRRLVRPYGGLRVYNENDPVASVGFGLLSLEAASGKLQTRDHGGLPVALVNDPLTRANPYTNHLRFCLDSDVVAAVPCLARYALPGLLYNPEQSSSHLPPTPMWLGPEDQKHRERHLEISLEMTFDIPEPPWFRAFAEWGLPRMG
jgi:hypothetical protein